MYTFIDQSKDISRNSKASNNILNWGTNQDLELTDIKTVVLMQGTRDSRKKNCVSIVDTYINGVIRISIDIDKIQEKSNEEIALDFAKAKVQLFGKLSNIETTLEKGNWNMTNARPIAQSLNLELCKIEGSKNKLVLNSTIKQMAKDCAEFFDILRKNEVTKKIKTTENKKKSSSKSSTSKESKDSQEKVLITCNDSCDAFMSIEIDKDKLVVFQTTKQFTCFTCGYLMDVTPSAPSKDIVNSK